jgi:hypothetical protein
MNTTKIPLAYANELNAAAKKEVSKGRNFFCMLHVLCTYMYIYICKEKIKWVSIAAILRLLTFSRCNAMRIQNHR